VQFSDIWVDGDAENFLNTQKFIQNLIKKEQPDLIVITGDVVDPAQESTYEGHW
jgi:predicted MPP superfamily phosphohydrolase